MPKRFTDTEKWKKLFFKTLPCRYKLFWIFITDDCSHSGIWEVEDSEITKIRIGEEIDLEKAVQFFNADEKRVHVFDSGRKWFIIPFVSFQYGDLSPNNKLHVAVRRELAVKGLFEFVPVRGPLEASLEASLEAPKEKDKEKEIRGIVKGGFPPSVEDCIAAFGEKGYSPAEAGKFWNHYDARGWMMGKNRMKKWRSAVATWIGQGKRFGTLEKLPPSKILEKKPEEPVVYVSDSDRERLIKQALPNFRRKNEKGDGK